MEPNHQLCMQGLQKTVQRIREASSQEVDMERAAHGMADPEVQAILSVRFCLLLGWVGFHVWLVGWLIGEWEEEGGERWWG